MQLSEIRINLCGPTFDGAHPALNHLSTAIRPCSEGHTRGGRLRAYCSLTFDHTFVVRDVKLIEGNDGLFLAMPSRKLCDRCRRCGEKNHLRARFCNNCGTRLDERRHNGRDGAHRDGRMKLHADIAHPINAACRLDLERRVIMAYLEEQERSLQPNYIPQNMDADLDGEIDRVNHTHAPALPPAAGTMTAH
ncbi:MAG: SpoVG family protein [Phycisphaerae bacterium]|nr:SpoVG family protein [Phycisphaerae bacterium]